ncbi:PadR family transcriptional regulator [Gordonia sp. HY285]|uniref:PadR family transcriptional regulator n=1 Tax=Gordonia liuliyuniae TaxID=2911517 RepID=UPI001F397C53|nr:PadR family transcriptional regulator [Gordonia liuliyuniae]MCF8612159.1 PadR family transcriptional regulator [Gordonia liuliyuniae]
MSAGTTRLLLLGAVSLFEPVNGYQIRRELLSWRVDEWASTRPGSIYHGLRRLAEDGLLRATAVDDDGRDVVVYEITPEGRTRLETLIVESIESVNVFDRRAFLAAFSLLPTLGEQRARAALTNRRTALIDALDELVAGRSDEYSPPHAKRTLDLWTRLACTEREWIDAVFDEWDDMRSTFDQAWAPPSDDPGTEMLVERDRYLRALRTR